MLSLVETVRTLSAFIVLISFYYGQTITAPTEAMVLPNVTDDAKPAEELSTLTLLNPSGLDAVASGPAEPAPEQVSDDEIGGAGPPTVFRAAKGARYRTWCVRLCDGYYYPINYLTTRDRLARDERICANSCVAPTRLFMNVVVGRRAQPMRDLQGHLYSDLPTAQAFRLSQNPDCTCSKSKASVQVPTKFDPRRAGTDLAASKTVLPLRAAEFQDSVHK